MSAPTKPAPTASPDMTEPRLVDRFVDPLADPVEDRARLRFASSLVFMGVLHFVVPAPFRKIVPRWIPAGPAVFWSGVAEVTAGALVAVPRTRRVGGWVALGTIAGVYPANIQMALDATRQGSKLKAVAAWLRLPMQFPMLLKAYKLTR